MYSSCHYHWWQVPIRGTHEPFSLPELLTSLHSRYIGSNTLIASFLVSPQHFRPHTGDSSDEEDDEDHPSIPSKRRSRAFVHQHPQCRHQQANHPVEGTVTLVQCGHPPKQTDSTSEYLVAILQYAYPTARLLHAAILNYVQLETRPLQSE